MVGEPAATAKGARDLTRTEARDIVVYLLKMGAVQLALHQRLRFDGQCRVVFPRPSDRLAVKTTIDGVQVVYGRLRSARKQPYLWALNATGLEVRSIVRPVGGTEWYRAFGDADAHKSSVLQTALKVAVATSLRTLLQAYVDFERHRSGIEAHYRVLLRGPIFDAIKLLPTETRGACAPDLEATSFVRTMSDLLKSLPWLTRRAVEPIFRSSVRALSRKCFAGGASPIRDAIQALLTGRAAMERSLVGSQPR
jgi:hypothetical protein